MSPQQGASSRKRRVSTRRLAGVFGPFVGAAFYCLLHIRSSSYSVFPADINWSELVAACVAGVPFMYLIVQGVHVAIPPKPPVAKISLGVWTACCLLAFMVVTPVHGILSGLVAAARAVFIVGFIGGGHALTIGIALTPGRVRRQLSTTPIGRVALFWFLPNAIRMLHFLRADDVRGDEPPSNGQDRQYI